MLAEDRDLRREAPPKTVPTHAAKGRQNKRGMDKQPDGQLCEPTTWLVAVRDRRERDAFVRLFEHFAPRLRSMLARSGQTGAAADDIIQDVMLRVWHKAGQFDPARASAAAWIYRIARNRHIDVIRKTARPVPEELYVEDGAYTDVAVSVGLDQEARRLRTALNGLTAEQRAVIEQAYMGELTHKEISEISGLPLGTIKSRIRLALDRLRHELKDLRSE
jgi:RNA polymerase sigma-70 factor (ECF subfamily)